MEIPNQNKANDKTYIKSTKKLTGISQLDDLLYAVKVKRLDD